MTDDNTQQVTRADLAELETRLRNDLLAAVDRHMDVSETKLRKSLADALEGHTQLLETLRDGVAEIRSFMQSLSERRTRREQGDASELAAGAAARTRARAQQTLDDTRPGRARAAVYCMYELPAERMPVDAGVKAQLDDDMRKLEQFVGGSLEVNDIDGRELDDAIARISALAAPPKEKRAAPPWSKFSALGQRSKR